MSTLKYNPFAALAPEKPAFVPTKHTVEIGEVGHLTDAMLAAMQTDELPRLIIAAQQAKSMTTAQLKRARKDKAETGRGWNEDWYRRAKKAEEVFGQQIMLIQAELTRRKGGAKTERNAALHREFVNVARDNLSGDVFRMWLDRAARRLRGTGERKDDAPVKPQRPSHSDQTLEERARAAEARIADLEARLSGQVSEGSGK